MAYPKIENNGASGSSSRKLDRPALDKKDFFSIKLEDSESKKQYVYAVVIIESRGTANSEISISNIHIENESNVAMSSFETAADGREITAIQDAYFTLSPLQKINGGYTSDVPFLGVVKSNFNTEQVKTAAWTGGSGTNDLPIAVRNEIGDGPSSYIKINLKASLDEVDTISDAATPFNDAEHIIPIYNHAYIEANPIPAGQYAAILIKADATSGLFTDIKKNTLIINHNSTGLTSTSADNYEIALTLSADNEFVFGASFLGNDFTDSEGYSSPTLYRTIKHIATDVDTGTSWNARDTTNPLSVAVYNPDDGLLYQAENYLNQVLPGSDFFTNGIYHVNDSFDDADIQTAWYANGYSFEEAELIVSDRSALPEEFNFSATTDDKFYQNSENILPSSANPFKVQGVKAYEFRHTAISESAIYQTSSIAAVQVVDKDSNVSSLYPNFTDTTKVIAPANIFGETIDERSTIEKSIKVNYLVYPQFTYGTTAITNYGKVVNLHNDSNKPTHAIVHKNDTYNTVITEANMFCPIVQGNTFYIEYSESSLFIKTQHNVRINVLSIHDVINKHGLKVEDGYYRGVGRVAVFLADGENTFLEDTSGSEATAVPNLTDKKIDYTIKIDSEIPGTVPETNLKLVNNHLVRNSDGSYKNMDKNGGFYTFEENFVAPITNWQPGYRHGQTWGTDRIPYYHNIYATGKTYKNLGAFYVARPFLQLNCLHKLFDTGSYSVSRLEFIAAPGLTPTASAVQSGIVNYSPSGTTTHLENSKELTVSTSEGFSDRITNYSNDDGSKTSQIAGAEVFGLEKFFGVGRLFVGPGGYQDVVGGKGFTKLITEDGDAAVATTASTASEIRAQFGKPTHPATVKRTNFAFTNDIASAKIRSRIFRPYGYDLTCSLNTSISDVIIGDVFVPTSVDTDVTAASTSHDGSTTVIDGLYTATSAGTSGAIVDVLDLDPKERGITFNGQTEIDSARFHMNPGTAASKENNFYKNIEVYYSEITDDQIVDGKFKTSFGFELFNIGHEDVFVKRARLFDPMYLPEGSYTIKPEAAQTPNWSLNNVTQSTLTFVSSAPALHGPSGVNIDWKDVDLNDESLALMGGIKKLKRATPVSFIPTNVDYTPSNTSLEVDFEVAISQAAGTYFQVLEIDYYRDEGITQNARYPGTTNFYARNLSKRRVWTSRVLLEVRVASTISSKIEILDTDGTVVEQNGTFDFGTIIG